MLDLVVAGPLDVARQREHARARARSVPRAANASPPLPTIVNNVETLANLPWIVCNGGAAFAALGSEQSTGMRMFALSGHVKQPGIYEVEFGTTTFRDLLYAPVYGGGIRDGNQLKAFIPGGASAPWFFEEHLDLPLDQAAVGKAGSMLGSGAIVVMDDTTYVGAGRLAPRALLRPRVVRQVHAVPRGHGWLDKIMHRIEAGQGRVDDLDLLLDVSDNISPGLDLAAVPDHDLPPRPVGACRRSLPSIRRSATSTSSTSRTAGAPIGATTERGGQVTDAAKSRSRTTSRSPSTGSDVEAQPGRAAHRRGRARRHLHPALLLPPADEAGRHVPHVPRRGRHRPRARRCSRRA